MKILRKVSTEGKFKRFAFSSYAKGYGIVYRSYLQGALRKGLDFNISINDMHIIMRMECHYCGSRPSNQTIAFIYNGVDRIDPDHGYVPDNVVPCCRLCNSMKSKNSADVFIGHARKVSNHNLPQ